MNNKSYPSLPAIRARERLLHSACRRVAALHEGGMNLEPAWAKVAREYHGRRLPGGKALLCSYGTLRRWWYRSSGGNDPEGFQDRRYLHTGESKIPKTLIVGLNRFALQSGMTCRAIFTKLGGVDGLGFSYPHLCRIIGDVVKQAARKKREVQRLCLVVENELRKGTKDEKGMAAVRRREVLQLGRSGGGRRVDAVCACGSGGECKSGGPKACRPTECGCCEVRKGRGAGARRK